MICEGDIIGAVIMIARDERVPKLQIQNSRCWAWLETFRQTNGKLDKKNNYICNKVTMFRN